MDIHKTWQFLYSMREHMEKTLIFQNALLKFWAYYIIIYTELYIAQLSDNYWNKLIYSYNSSYCDFYYISALS